VAQLVKILSEASDLEYHIIVVATASYLALVQFLDITKKTKKNHLALYIDNLMKNTLTVKCGGA
jgi:F0F1-type ATP synthase alpha subunit